MTNAEKSTLKRTLKANYKGIAAEDLGDMLKLLEQLAALPTKHNTPARVAKLMYLYIITTKNMYGLECEDYEYKPCRKYYFSKGNYDFLSGVVDENEAIELVLLSATDAVAIIFGENNG